MMSRALLTDVNPLTSRRPRSQQSISSGRQITAPSDNPLGTQRALGLRSVIEALAAAAANIDEATGWMQTSDDALG